VIGCRTSHTWIIRTSAAFWHRPRDVLARVLDIAGFTVHAVLRIDLQTRESGGVLYDFINTDGAISPAQALQTWEG
jgi:hypothetical protein